MLTEQGQSTEDLLGSLTDSQRQAVTHVAGPLLVLAGPGSGKTRVITHRIAYLIRQGIEADHILAITFTNKAAEEMRQRLAVMAVGRGSTLCTFHSLCARLLRQFADRAQLAARFSIYDQADQVHALRAVMKQLELDTQQYSPVRILGRISACKNDLILPEQFAEQQQDFFGQIVARVYAAYQKRLAECQALDFDDLLLKFSYLLRDEPEVRDRLNDRYRYVLVDEYQDTNHCQYQIVRGLTLNHRNLCVTGDPDQSIYRWRGADIGNILAFEKDYPEAQVVRLEENFRSTPQVLSLADQMIQHNRRRKHKKLYTRNPPGEPPELVECPDERGEAVGLVQWIQALRRRGLDYRQMAVFYRVNAQSRVLEEALLQAHIPYQIVRGVEFFQRREIKDLLAYLRLVANPADQVSLRRIINRPTRGIGSTTVERLFAHAERTGRDVWRVLGEADQVPTLQKAAQTKVKRFVGLIETFRRRLEGPMAVGDLIRDLLDQSGLRQELQDQKGAEALENVEELINDAAQYDVESESPSLEEYLQQVALYSDHDAYDENAGAVCLMTLHAAKGLEFPAVQITGVEEGLIPHTRSLDEAEALEEERRLLFVGMTRAQKHLRLSYARYRSQMGSSRATILSIFLRGLEGLTFRSYSDESDDESLGDPDEGARDRTATPPVDPAEDRRKEDQEPKEAAPPASILRKGQLVRHPKLGLGRIQQITASGPHTFAVVQFNRGGAKTLDLQYARLETVESP